MYAHDYRGNSRISNKFGRSHLLRILPESSHCLHPSTRTGTGRKRENFRWTPIVSWLCEVLCTTKRSVITIILNIVIQMILLLFEAIAQKRYWHRFIGIDRVTWGFHIISCFKSEKKIFSPTKQIKRGSLEKICLPRGSSFENLKPIDRSEHADVSLRRYVGKHHFSLEEQWDGLCVRSLWGTTWSVAVRVGRNCGFSRSESKPISKKMFLKSTTTRRSNNERKAWLPFTISVTLRSFWLVRLRGFDQVPTNVCPPIYPKVN